MGVSLTSISLTQNQLEDRGGAARAGELPLLARQPQRLLHAGGAAALRRDGLPRRRDEPLRPRDRGAWWAAVYGVTQSQTQLSD